MNDTIKTILYSWMDRKIPDMAPRSVTLGEYITFTPRKILVLTGFRRCGKTYIALGSIKRLLDVKNKKKVIYVNFEDERIPRETKFLSDLIPSIKETFAEEPDFLFLDEIQDVPEWSRWLRRIYDNYDMQIIVTGSSSKVSSREIPTELRGRCLEIKVYPLSFKEYLSFKGIQVDAKSVQYSENERAKIVRALDDYLYYGGMPEVVLAPEEKKIEILQQYYNTVVSKDIAERYKIRNDEALRALLRLLVNSTQYSISKTYNTMKSMGYTVGKTSLANYISYIESSYFLISIPILSPKIKEQMQCPRKAYLIDNGFISALSTRFSKNVGRLYENAVALELLRRSDNNTSINYWKDRFGKEVDFVIKAGDTVRELVQVCYDVEHPDTKAREVNALLRASEELKCDDMMVVTGGYEGEERVKGRIIKFVPLWKYLLDV
jgi:predicted AAA+ superfamily ATPase